MAQSITVTNVGDKPQKVTATTRMLGHTVSDTSGSAAINTATAPAYIDAFGISRSFTVVHFTVAENVDRLTMWAAAPTAPFAGRIILIDPSGAYTAYSIPQGAANTAISDVRYPAGGHLDGIPRAVHGQRVQRELRLAGAPAALHTDGIVFPSSFTLAPGASRQVTVFGQEPSQPGDVSASVQFNGSVSGDDVRAVLAPRRWPPFNSSFTGTVTGGNGRGLPGPVQRLLP